MKPNSLLFRAIGVPLFSLIWLCSPSGSAEEKPGGALRLFPVGEAPPFEWIEEGGIVVEKDPPEGSVPPSQVVHVLNTGEAKGKAVVLRRDEISLAVPTISRSVTLHEAGPDGAKPQAWHTASMPAGISHALAILWRDPKAKSWSAARSMTLEDGLEAFPAGMLRFVNVSTWTADVEFAGEEFTLAPGTIELKGRANTGLDKVGLEISIRLPSGRAGRVYSGQLSQTAEERTNIVVYTADGTRPRRPAKVVVRPERAKIVLRR